MKHSLKEALGLVSEDTVGVQDARTRWPWIRHFDSVNDEGIPHPGNWVAPSEADFMHALPSIPFAKLQRWLAPADVNNKADVVQKLRRSPKLRKRAFDIWAKIEHDTHRDAQNTYFEPSRRRDREAAEKAEHDDPMIAKMRAMRISHDNAEILGMPWFPDD